MFVDYELLGLRKGGSLETINTDHMNWSSRIGKGREAYTPRHKPSNTVLLRVDRAMQTPPRL